MSYTPSSTAARAQSVQPTGRLVSMSLPCPDLSPEQVLRCAAGQPRFYFADGRSGLVLVGIGAALEYVAWGASRFERIERAARDLFGASLNLSPEVPLAAPRLFGGFSFSDDAPFDQAWAEFPPARFVLPHYQLTVASGQCWLTLNAQAGDDELADLPAALCEALRHKIAELQTAAYLSTPPPSLCQIDYPLSRQAWADGIEQARSQIHNGALKKVVLARYAEARFAAPPDVDAALARLGQRYPETYRFLFEPRPSCAFFGATPELLVRSDGERMATMALAGSARRGATPDEDAGFGRGLLESAKDRQEHQIVVDAVRARLAPLTSQLTVGTTGLLRLQNIQHLHTPIDGQLAQANGVLPLVATLHPTAALGGEPREAAAGLIQRLENFLRGWYAGPIGWIDQHLDGQFVVAIRSAVAQQQRVWLYAGAGIVAESNPQREWDETALKFRPLLEALQIT